MADKMRVPILKPDGTVAHEIGTLVKVVEANEPWSEYTLEDGTRLRMKQTIITAVRLNDKDDNGDPMYSIQSQQTLSVITKVEE
jgi:hypothetical protein